MADLTFKATNLLNKTDIPEIDWILSNAAWVSGELVVQPGGSAYADIPTTLLDQTSIYYKLDLEFEGNVDVSNSFNPSGNIYIEGSYNSGKREDYYILLNRLSNVGGVYSDSTVLETNGTKLDTMRVYVYNNNSSSVITVTIIELFQSQDLDPSTLVDVSLESVLAAEVMNALNVWTKLLVVDSVETNISVKAAVNSYVPRRDFIKIFENTIEFREEQLNENDFEQLVLSDGVGGTYPVWYTSIEPATDAYEYVTLTDPNVFISGLTELQRDNFRYMVRTSNSNIIKMAIEFKEFNFGGTLTTVPTIVIGAGNGVGDNGKAFIYKDLTGLVMNYYSSTGLLRQMRMDDDGISFTPDIISGGGSGTSTSSLLQSLEFYDDGFVPTYASGRALWYWTLNSNGEITELNDDSGNTITISYNTGNIPY